MKTHTTNVRNRRTLAQNFRATFGPIDAPRAGRKSLLALGVACLLIAGAASADWRVYDDDVHETLENMRDEFIQKDGGSVTTHLKNVNDRLTIKGDELITAEDSDADKKLVKPKESADELPTDKPTKAQGVDLAARCPSGSLPSAGALGERHKVCEEMYQTEIAKYRFSLEMYELAQERNEKLNEIIQERNGLNEKDFAKMEENTNKLVALTAQMDNDRDRYVAYMNAYDARMLHLQKASDLLSQRAINGSGEFDPISGGVGALTLATALRTAAKTDERSCTPRMQQAGVC